MAGTKDKRAVTSQLVTAKSMDPNMLARTMANDYKIAVGNFKPRSKIIQLGDLKVIFP